MDGARQQGELSRWCRCAVTAALEIIAPTRCAGCERPGALICDDCLAAMTPIDPVYACLRCGAPFGDALCTECGASSAGTSDRCLASTVFEGPAPRIVRAYKDAGERRLSQPIAELLLDAAEHAEHVASERYGGIISQVDAVTFVPVTASAYARRGFDHMQRIAEAFSHMAGLPMVDVLLKHGRADQRALGRTERREQASGVYEVVEPVRGMRLLLLDDVITTGATVGAARDALYEAGAAHVDALAFARVW